MRTAFRATQGAAETANQIIACCFARCLLPVCGMNFAREFLTMHVHVCDFNSRNVFCVF